MYELTIWLRKLLPYRLLLRLKRAALFLAIPCVSFSQSLTLQQAYDLARENYPLIAQKGLIKQTAALTLNNIGRGWLPQLSFNGQASYQSEATGIDISFPGINITPPEKDQYKMTADISQLIYDGGLTRQQKVLRQLDAAVEDQQVELELYKLKERINQAFLGILFLEEQIKQVDLIKQDILTGIKTVEAQVQNGVAFRSNLNILQAESIKNDQRLIELNASRKSLLETLSLFINRPLDENSKLEQPVPEENISADIVRPEIKLFSDQSVLLDQQLSIIRAKNLPKTSLFLQGGYGRPGLNLLKNEFDLFYIGGIRFNWSLGGLYTRRNDRELVSINKRMIDSREQTFLLNIKTQLSQQHSEIDKLKKLIASDDQIIALRKSIKDAAKAQLENGVISANDYLREINAEDQARQTLIAHQIQLLQAKINYQTITGK